MKINGYMKAYKYAQDVVSGEILAGKYIIKSCEHFLEMINNKESEYYQKYFIDETTLKIVDGIISLTNFATGELAGKSCYHSIAGFQWFILINLYCVFHRDNPKKRRYENACVFISRKNSKTWLVSMFMLLGLLLEPNYAQLVAGANTREQSKLLFNEIKKTLEVSPKLLKHFRILSNKIICKRNNNTLFNVSGDARNLDGLLVSIGCIDEYASAKDSAVYDSLQTSMLATVNKLIFTISTGYPYPDNPMLQQIEYGKKVLDGAVKDDKFFLMCYELDKDDNWTDTTKYIKSNPLQATSKIGMEFLESNMKMALEMPSKQISFRCKNLNQWLSDAGEDNYIDFELWKKCRTDKVDFKGKEVIVGIDASLTTDITGISLIYKEDDIYYIKSIGIIPRESLKDRKEKFNYLQAEIDGEVLINDGYIISYDLLEQTILDIPSKYNCTIKCICYDSYNMTQTAEKLSNAGYETIAIKQNYSTLSNVIKTFRELVYTDKIRYEKSSLFDWNVSCTRTTKDKYFNEILSKNRSANNSRIDLMSSTIFAMTEAIKIEYIKKFNLDDLFMI